MPHCTFAQELLQTQGRFVFRAGQVRVWTSRLLSAGLSRPSEGNLKQETVPKSTDSCQSSFPLKPPPPNEFQMFCRRKWILRGGGVLAVGGKLSFFFFFSLSLSAQYVQRVYVAYLKKQKRPLCTWHNSKTMGRHYFSFMSEQYLTHISAVKTRRIIYVVHSQRKYTLR